MDYNATLKGRISETVVKIILEDAGYIVCTLGIENTVSVLPLFSRAEYLSLGVSQVLKKLPDFFVIDRDCQKTWLLEVKYRKHWNEETRSALGAGLIDQVRTYRNIVLLIALGNSAHTPHPDYPPSNEPSYFHRVAPLFINNGILCFLTATNSAKNFSDAFWEEFWRIQDFFPKINSRYNQQTIRKGIEILKGLNQTEYFDS